MPALADFGSGQILSLVLIAVELDLAGVDGTPCDARFAYRQLGGIVNLRVNGVAHEAAKFSDLDGVIVAPGVAASVAVTPEGDGESGGDPASYCIVCALARARVAEGRAHRSTDVTTL